MVYEVEWGGVLPAAKVTPDRLPQQVAVPDEVREDLVKVWIVRKFRYEVRSISLVPNTTNADLELRKLRLACWTYIRIFENAEGLPEGRDRNKALAKAYTKLKMHSGYDPRKFKKGHNP